MNSASLAYPNYKPSGVPYIGDVPKHWAVAEVKHFYEIQMGKMLQPRASQPTDTEVPYLKAVNVQWYSVRPDNTQKMWASPEEVEQLEVMAGDLLVCEGGEGGRSGIIQSVPKGVIIQNALHRVRARKGASNEFLQHLMKVVAETGWFDAINNKATIAHFTKEKFEALSIPLPPLNEQVAIVRYLDNADQRIRAYVSAKERLIALLEEKRQAVIHQAVTRGLDPNVRLKPSGVEWLGDVPEQWQVAQFGRQVEIAEGQVDPKAEPYASMLVIAPNHVESGTGRLLSRETAFEQGAISGKYICRDGDVIYSKIRPALAKVTVAPTDCLCSADMYPLRPQNSLHRDYLLWLLLSTGFTAWSTAQSDRVAMPKVNRQTLNNTYIPLPPYSEQASITQHLTEATQKASRAIDRARRQIELMEEYRTRLIADVVTGKIDVSKN